MIHAKRRAIYIFLWYNFLTMLNVNLILLNLSVNLYNNNRLFGICVMNLVKRRTLKYDNFVKPFYIVNSEGRTK